MDSTTLLYGIFWMLIFGVGFLLIVLGGLVSLILASVFRQGAGSIIPGRNGAGDEQQKGTGGGGPDLEARQSLQTLQKEMDKEAKRTLIVIDILGRRVDGFKAEYEEAAKVLEGN